MLLTKYLYRLTVEEDPAADRLKPAPGCRLANPARLARWVPYPAPRSGRANPSEVDKPGKGPRRPAPSGPEAEERSRHPFAMPSVALYTDGDQPYPGHLWPRRSRALAPLASPSRLLGGGARARRVIRGAIYR